MVVTFFFCKSIFFDTLLGTSLDANGCPSFLCPRADPNGPNRTDLDTKMGQPAGDALSRREL
jgi:hypothetical protein